MSNAIRRLEVDGEVFEVTTRVDLPGQVDLAWITGPNAGYGFSSRRSSGVHSDDRSGSPWMVTGGELAPLPVSNVDIPRMSEPNGQSEVVLGDCDAPLAWLADEMGLLAFVKPVVITPVARLG
jgi:hypothetical protein